jgi:addiction module HigA family antidote
MAVCSPESVPAPTGRVRLTPGVFLDTRFLKPMNLSQRALAKQLGVSRRRINEIVCGRRVITTDTAMRLGRYFGTGPEFWLSLQAAWDLYEAGRHARRSTALDR